MEGRTNGSLTIRTQIWLGNILPISQINNLETKFWVKNTLVASYSRVVIA